MLLTVTAAAQEIGSVGVTKADLLNYLTDHNDLPSADDMKKEKRMYDAINSSWPEASKLIETIIYETHDRDVLISACNIIERKMGTGASSSANRKLILNVITKTAEDDGFNKALIRMLAKCCTIDDAPYLLDVMAKNSWLQAKVDAAAGLSRVGDSDTLKEMKRIYLELKTNEPARYMAERRGMEDSLRGMNGSNAVINIPRPKRSYLDDISAEIEKLQKRLRPRICPLLIVIPSVIGVLVACSGVLWWFSRRARSRKP
jgi:hypothetical protein